MIVKKDSTAGGRQCQDFLPLEGPKISRRGFTRLRMPCGIKSIHMSMFTLSVFDSMFRAPGDVLRREVGSGCVSVQLDPLHDFYPE